MNPKQQYILARDMIDMIRDYKDDSDVLEYLDSFCFSIARILEDKSIVSWDDIAGICDQRYYSIRQGNPLPLDDSLLDSIYAKSLNAIDNSKFQRDLSSTSYMSELQRIVKRLQEIVELEGKESLDQLGSYIVGTLIIDEDGYKLYQTNESLARIGDLGSDLEASNGGEEWMKKDWEEIKLLVGKLGKQQTIELYCTPI